ncbi:MFS transporter [Roseobacteraceae bacterium S113]
MTKTIHLDAAHTLPFWQRPKTLLFLLAAILPLSFSTWMVLINNFAHEMAGFDGSDMGWLHTFREIPGFLAIAVIYLLYLFREQVLVLLSLVLLGAATALTGFFPTWGGIMVLTVLSSIGYHYYETVNQSLQMQWLTKEEAPRVMGQLLAMGSASTFVAYVAIILAWDWLGLTYEIIFLVAGLATTLLALLAMALYPQFETPNPQRKEMVLRKRYWLYYALQFMSGARRQIFIVFAAFMMVERFGYAVHEVTGLFLATLVVNIIVAPLLGRAVAFFGERAALIFEYVGLFGIFVAYAGIYYLDWGATVGAVLYVLNHIFFSLALAIKTYFQKIADPGDIAPTAAVAFTINHIAAVFLPAILGYVWITSPGFVFVLAAGMALVSLALSLLIPRHPEAGRETIFSPPAEASLAR